MLGGSIHGVSYPAGGPQTRALGAVERYASRWRYLLGVALLAGAYYAAAHLGYALSFAGPVASIVWLPVGVGIAFLYLAGIRFWPGVVIGDLLVNNYSALPLGSALGQSCGNVLEVVAATALLQRVSGRARMLESIAGVAGMLGALLAGTALSATVGSISLRLGDVIDASLWPHVWRTWLLGDFSGALIVFPLVVAWWRAPVGGWRRVRWREPVVVFAAVVALTEVALRADRPLVYIVFPALMWAALRFRQRGATLAVAISAGMGVWSTTHDVGPFVYQSINHTVLSTQLYIAVAAVSALAVAALVGERETLARQVQTSRARIVEAGDRERHRLERNLHDGAQQRLVALAARLSLGAEQSVTDPPRAPELFRNAREELLAAIEDLRELAHGIHPSFVRDFGLASALGALAKRSTVSVEVAELPSVRLDEMAEATAYYLVAEALANAEKHASARAVGVTARVTRSRLQVEVRDDGVGGAAERRGSGLEGLKDRVEAVGGSFSVESPPGRGTSVRASLPCRISGAGP